jgi:uncharacterized protein (DUF3820 family)
MRGAMVFGAQPGKDLLRGVAAGNGQHKRNESAFAVFDVGMDWLGQGVDRQSVLPFRGSGYYKYRDFSPFSAMTPEVLQLLVSREMPYGKYKGRLLADLPGHYLGWFAREGFPKGELGSLLALMYELDHNALRDLLAPLRSQASARAAKP